MRRLIVTLLVSLATVLGGVAVAPPAQAATGWTTIHRWPRGSVFLACKYTESGPYGPVWQVRLVLAHHPDEAVRHLRASFVVRRRAADGSYQEIGRKSLATDNVGQWDVDTATGSQIGARHQGRWYADRWSWGIGDENGGLGDADPHRYAEISDCG